MPPTEVGDVVIGNFSAGADVNLWFDDEQATNGDGIPRRLSEI